MEDEMESLVMLAVMAICMEYFKVKLFSFGGIYWSSHQNKKTKGLKVNK